MTLCIPAMCVCVCACRASEANVKKKKKTQLFHSCSLPLSEMDDRQTTFGFLCSGTINWEQSVQEIQKELSP